MSVTQMPPVYEEVVLKGTIVFSSSVTVSEPKPIGTPLITKDGGESFSIPLETEKPNGILCENLDQSDMALVLTSGIVKEKNIPGITPQIKINLFENGIVAI
ncbi:MAG: hypothetical protein AB7D34_08975 [Sulfurimonas sp.]